MTRNNTAAAAALLCAAVCAAAACDDVDVTELDAIALHREQAATDPGGGGTTPPPSGPPAYCAYLPVNSNFPRISDGFSMYAGSLSEPEKPAAATYNFPSNPSNNAEIWLKWTLPYPACPPSVSQDQIATYGKVTVDGSAAGVEYFHVYPSGVPNEFSATVHMPTVNIFGGHQVKLSYTNPRLRGATPITSSLTVTFTQVNPFFYLQRSYASARCQTCHAFGAGSMTASDVGHPFTPPSDSSSGCISCHQPFFDKYQPTEERFYWKMPGAAKNMDWSQMTPFAQCLVTVGHLSTPEALHDHFDNDPRLKWAVESGLLHYPSSSRPTSFPHNVPDFLEIADAWIDQGFSCANIDPMTRWNTIDVYQ